MPIDHTQIEALQRCDQEWLYRHHHGYASRYDSLPAFFGQAVHAGVKAFYAGADDTTLVSTIDRFWVDNSQQLAPPGPKPDYRTASLAQAICRLYAATYPAATRGYDVVLNEAYLEHGEDCGIVDRVIRRHADGLLYVLDLKTSAWAANTGYWRQWSNSQQAAIYIDLASAKLGEQVAGFICDYIFVSGRKDGPKAEDFQQSMPVTYSEAKLAEMREQRGQWRHLMQHLAEMPEDARQSTRSCFRYNSACMFLPYCSADPADRHDLLHRDLTVGTLEVRRWEPAMRDGGGE